MSNRLKHEDSPYLQQHKNNPIEWYPWCDEAFSKAKSENRAIFISIGYSSCHWCHVMEREVFENEEIASFLNENIVCIKVDREERPDIDAHYQEVYQLLNGSAGGWPTSIFCTPDKKPFYARTYIPPHNRDRVLGFSELMKIVTEKVNSNDSELYKNADEIEKFLAPSDRPKEATKIVPELISKFISQAKFSFDDQNGGFSQSPKFPQSAALNTLLDIYSLNSDESAKEMVIKTLDNLSLGGMYDLIDGGFCRYSVDERWLVPHFEKMCYDNALLIDIYTKSYKTFGDEYYKKLALDSTEFMIGFMSENYLFYSASDADTNGTEGEYFVYSYDELLSCIDDKELLSHIEISTKGNFEGKNIIRLKQRVIPENFKMLKVKLADIRKSRTYPFVDKKIITAWNAMMIKTLFNISSFDEKYLNFAKKSLENLLDTMYINNKLYHSALIESQPKIEAFLEDYSYLGVALIKAYETTFDENYLIKAQLLTNSALEKFFENGRWYFSKGEFNIDGDIYDSTYPSAVSLMVDLLLSLGVYLEEKYRIFAFKSIEYYSAKMANKPFYSPYLFNQSMRYIHEDRVIKSSAENLKKITKIDYPYTKLQLTTDTEYMICGQNSCFSNTKDVNELDKLIKKSLK